ncbi:unnamed protein product [Caenorhabditis angaria]|uniref:Peptidase M13 C-terminal domain-containing protein n=1 Tax=Caenorhabditis angaria TaxID=860376 RepID=A0A9P1MXK5_9PELO|nr:unnamed protein product [Caenorhabditis angaria]
MKTPSFLKKRKVQYAILITGFLLTLSLFIAILIGSVGDFINHDNFKPICETEKCFELGNRMALLMDNSTDPCIDFYKFSCGNFEKNVDPSENYGTEIYNNLFIDRKNFTKYLNFSTFQPKTTPQRIAAVLWNKCVETKSVEIYETDIWKKLDLTDILLEMAKVSIAKTQFLKNDIMALAFPNEQFKLYLKIGSGIEKDFKTEYTAFYNAIQVEETEKRAKSNDNSIFPFNFLNIKKYMLKLLPNYSRTNTNWELIYFVNQLTALQQIVNSKGVAAIRDVLKKYYDEKLSSYVVENKFSGKDREEKCFKVVEKMFPGTLAMIFVEQFVPKENLKRANEILDEVKNVFNEMIDENNWMEQELKNRLKKEANLIKSSIGIPDEYKNMKNIEKMYENIEKSKKAKDQTYLELVRNLLKMNSEETFLRVARKEQITYAGQPLHFSANYFGGSHRASMAPIFLNYPYIDFDLPNWNIYASFAFVLSHEVGHAFDAHAFKLDQDYNKYPISPKTEQEFKKRVDCLIEKYNKFKFSDGTFSNGNRTKQEDTADKIGFELVSRLFRKLLDEKRQQRLPVIDQYTVQQQFYQRLAYDWCSKETVGTELAQYKNDVHSLGEFRVNGIMSNSDGFSEAFGCKKNTPMNPENKCQLY